jgi:valyl-tRNA synthetase
VLEEALDPALEAEMATLQDLIVTIRALRKDLEVPERELASAEILAPEKIQQLASTNREIIEKLGRVSSLSFPARWTLSPANTRTTANFTVGLAYEKQIDFFSERERLQKKLEQYEKVLINADRQLQNESFLSKAPEKIVAGLKKQASEAALLRKETLEAIVKLEQLA